MLLGAGRNRVEDSIEPSAGGVLFVKRGQEVRTGDPLFELRYKQGTTLNAALEEVKNACRIEEAPLSVPPLILETLS
jgi:thymidine phosphorylase